MARELLIEGYLLFVKVVFSICKLFPLRNKVTFITSFGDNCQFVLDEINKQQVPIQKVILQKSGSTMHKEDDGQTIVLPFETKNVVHMLRSTFHLATSKWIIIDNYFGLLAAVTFKQNVTCVQLWHAVGAVKQFGLRDPSVQNRSNRAKQRFLDVYHRFQYVVTGSDTMAQIFKTSFQLDDKQIIRTGVPRTDFFFDEKAKAQSQKAFYKQFPELKKKKIILYAPTFRDDALYSNSIALDLDVLYRELSHLDYTVVLKLHPAVTMKEDFQQKFPGFVYQIHGEFHVNDLLLVTDLLITDYSSIPFEFSFLNKPMLFFAYDLEQYVEQRGFWEDYVTSMPGPVVYTTMDLVKKIQLGDFQLEKVKSFKHKWNEYSTGQSSKKLVDLLFKDEIKTARDYGQANSEAALQAKA